MLMSLSLIATAHREEGLMHASLYKNLPGYSVLLIYIASIEISNLIGYKPILFVTAHIQPITGKLS